MRKRIQFGSSSLAGLCSLLLICFACACSGERKGNSTADLHATDSAHAEIAAFKDKAGRERFNEWKQLKPLLEERLNSVPKSKSELSNFFLEWLGPSEPDAVAACKGAVVWPLEPQPIKGDVLAYKLHDENGDKDFLVIDFRNVAKPVIGIVSEYDPPHKEDQHDRISASERTLASELHAQDINLGGGSLDGTYKSGFFVVLEGNNVTSVNLKKAGMLSTLVSLHLEGDLVTDDILSLIKGHKYLASISLSKTRITDKGVQELQTCPSLKFLTIEKSFATKEGAEALKKALPLCTVELE